MVKEDMEAQDHPPGDASTSSNEERSTDALAQLEVEKADLKDKLLRTLAEMENFRRRTEREMVDTRTYAIAKFAGDMLAVADNMARALAAIPAAAREGDDPILKAIAEGAELTEREMHRALEKHGVKKIDPKGERFDPHFHQAMFEVADSSIPNGSVAQVVQIGYVIGDRVLRPALVGVARGGAPMPAKDIDDAKAGPDLTDEVSER